MPKDKLISKTEILRAIRNSLVHQGLPPTIEELRQTLAVGSTRTILRYLRWLEEEGDIKRWPGARGIRLCRDPEAGVETRAVPLVGEAPAGPLTFAEENLDGWVRLPIKLTSPRSARFFLLRVRGNSMDRAVVEGERIENGDLVLVRQEATAEPGTVVVALIDGEVTIKRFAQGPGYCVLRPDSTDPSYQPIILDGDFRVQGVVQRVFKKGAEILNTIEE
jgi:repressor LexA